MSADIGAVSRPQRRLATGLILILVLLGVLSGAGADRAEAKPPREFFGVVPSVGLSPTDIPAMQQSGVGTLRVNFYWPLIEESPGQFNWGPTDDLVASATGHGIRVFPTLLGTPGWVNFLAGRNSCGGVCAPDADVSRDAFEAFAKAVAERYGPGGDFWTASGGDCGIPTLCPAVPAPCGCTQALPITSWQIWNEQNSPKYYRPAPDPAAYAQLVSSASAGLRAADPGAQVVLGGMWGPESTDSVIPTVEFLKRFYAVPGIENEFDAVSIHPYAPTIKGFKDQLKRARRVINQAGDSSVGTWVTELGWASGGPKNGLVKTPKAQARLLRKSFKYLIQKRRAWHVRGVTWYSWRDAPPSQTDCDWCPRAGLRTQSGVEKRAGLAFKRLALGR